MKKVSILILAILLSAITLSGFAAAQSSGYTYTINIQGILSQFGLGGSDTIVNVGGVSQVVLTDPVIVMGSGLDIEEKQILRSVQAGDLDESRVVPDTARQFNGQDAVSL